MWDPVWEAFFAVPSTVKIGLRHCWLEKFAVRAVNWWKRPGWKLSNLSKNPRLSVVRANFGGSGAKRKLEAKRVLRFAFPLFTNSDFPLYLFVYLVCGTLADITLDINLGNEVIKWIQPFEPAGKRIAHICHKQLWYHFFLSILRFLSSWELKMDQICHPKNLLHHPKYQLHHPQHQTWHLDNFSLDDRHVFTILYNFWSKISKSQIRGMREGQKKKPFCAEREPESWFNSDWRKQQCALLVNTSGNWRWRASCNFFKTQDNNVRLKRVAWQPV